MSALAASEIGIIAAAVLYHWLFTEGLILANRLIVVVAIAPCGLVFRWTWLPGAWLLHKLLTVILLGFKLLLAVIISGLMLSFSYESLVPQSLEVRKVQHTELTTESVIQSSQKPVNLSFFGGHVMGRVPCQIIKLVQILPH